MDKHRTGATTTGASRSKGHTNLANLANLAEREKSHNSLHLSAVELIKTLMKIIVNNFALSPEGLIISQLRFR